MTPLEFKAARFALGLNQRQMAEALRVGGEAVIRSWESGRRPISGPASVAVELMLARINPPKRRAVSHAQEEMMDCYQFGTVPTPDRSGETDETRSGSAEGESGLPEGSSKPCP